MASTATKSKAERRFAPYIWVTWLSFLIAGDAQCKWAAWFKAHYGKYDKVPRDGDLANWKVNHAEMVTKLVATLRAEGWTVYVEGENDFKLKGKLSGVTLAGCPDIVAIKDDLVRVIDCKTGQRRDSDIGQVMLYLMALPKVFPQLLRGLIGQRKIVGVVHYTDGELEVPYEQFEQRKARILDVIQDSSNATAPAKSPSGKECRFCDITKADCPERVEKQTTADTGDF